MTQLLVSVRDVAEARASIEGGADFVDIKEPSRGSLGPASAEVVNLIVRQFAGRTRLSAACGELLDTSFQRQLLPTELEFAKFGMSRCGEVSNWRDILHAAWRRIPATVTPVAVAYADWHACGAPPPEAIVHEAAVGGCRYVLFDTFDKRQGDLLHWGSVQPVEQWLHLARDNKLGIVIAGSLRASTLPLTLPWEPDVVAVRGAACRGGRTGGVCRDRVRRLRQVLDRYVADGRARRHGSPPSTGPPRSQ